MPSGDRRPKRFSYRMLVALSGIIFDFSMGIYPSAGNSRREGRAMMKETIRGNISRRVSLAFHIDKELDSGGHVERMETNIR